MKRALLASLLTVAILTPVGADAATPTRKKAIWGPVEREGVSQFPIYRELGVGLFQMQVFWADIAPTRPATPTDPNDPAYRWPAEVDVALAHGAAHGIGVVVQVSDSPRWASGHAARQWAPRRASDFADFVEAASRRYPAVGHWMIWREPTRPDFFQPLATERLGRPLSAKARRGPRRYAQLLDAAYVRLKRVDRGDLVIGGNTFTTGSITPRTFIAALRLPNGRRPRLDLYGHNPFSARTPRLSDPALQSGYADFSSLDTLAGWLDRDLKRGVKLYLSEYMAPTDHSNHETNFWVTPAVQARWTAAAMRITRTWSRIYSLGMFLYDDPPRADRQEVNRGLLRYDGTRKPAFAAFRDG